MELILKIPVLEQQPFEIIGAGSLQEPLFNFLENLNQIRYRYLLAVNNFLIGSIKKKINSNA